MVDITKQKFGRLIALKPTDERGGDGCVCWLCRCSCGNMSVVSINNLRRGITKSCGCYKKERTSQSHKKYNDIIHHGDTIEVVTSNKRSFIIDAKDYPKIKDVCWSVGDDGRVSGWLSGKRVRVHQLILSADNNKVIDHINHDATDNRRCNLRLSNKSQNGMNRPCNKNNKLGIKGVYQLKNGKYTASIMVNYKSIYLGCFCNLDDAISARQKAEEKYFGEYAYKGDK